MKQLLTCILLLSMGNLLHASVNQSDRRKREREADSSKEIPTLKASRIECQHGFPINPVTGEPFSELFMRIHPEYVQATRHFPDLAKQLHADVTIKFFFINEMMRRSTIESEESDAWHDFVYLIPPFLRYKDLLRMQAHTAECYPNSSLNPFYPSAKYGYEFANLPS